MLNFRNTLVLVCGILVALLGLDFVFTISKWYYAGIIIVFVVIMAYGSKVIQSDFYVRSLSSGSRKNGQIALTFDDGPDAQVTPMILDVLKKHNIKAAFFIIGSRAEFNPEIIKRIDREGHMLGSHSYSHAFLFDLYSSRRMRDEIELTEKIIQSMTGKKMRLFRPPYGVTNPPLAKAVNRLQYHSIGWSLKSNDTVIDNEPELLNRLNKKIKPGDIILMHDNKPWNVKVLDDFLSGLKEKNLAAVRLDKFLNIQPYEY
jgi:peptidoglycan/xylan/chitin deacetylase (PgdA/CDA1 family)